MGTHEDFYWMPCSRIRTKRHKKRMQREDADKQLIRKHKEEKAIWSAVRNLGWTELKPPTQQGFVRFFVLRGDVARTKEAPFFLKLLDKINTRQWSHRRDFKKKRRRYGKKVYVVREQNLRDIWESNFARKFDEKERLYFYETLVHYGNSKTPYKVFRFLEPWRFVLRIQPNMITKVRVKDLDLERQGAEINRYFEVDNRRARLWKLLYGNNRWKSDFISRGKYDNPLENKSLSSILDEHWPEQGLKVTFKNPQTSEGFLFMWIV